MPAHPHGFTIACPECGDEAAKKQSRAQARRALARHLINQHGWDEDEAWDSATALMPREAYEGEDPRWAARDERNRRRAQQMG